MIFKITSPPALKSLAAYSQPKYAPYHNLIKAYFTSKAAVWEVVVVIAQSAGHAPNSVTLLTVPHLDTCLQNPSAVFHTPHAPQGSQAYEAALFSLPSRPQLYAHECENGKCFRTILTAEIQSGVNADGKQTHSAGVDSVEKLINVEDELPFRYRIFVSSAKKPEAGSKLKLSLEIQTPEGIRQPAGFLEPLANKWIAMAYKGTAFTMLP